MVALGDSDVSVETIIELNKYFNIKVTEESDELRLIPKEGGYTTDEVRAFLPLVIGLCPDEVDTEQDGCIRLWWD